MHEYFPPPLLLYFFYASHATPPHHTDLTILSFKTSVSPFKIKDGKCKEETERSTAKKATQKNIAGFQYSLLFTQKLWLSSPFDIIFTWMSLHLFSIPRGRDDLYSPGDNHFWKYDNVTDNCISDLERKISIRDAFAPLLFWFLSFIQWDHALFVKEHQRNMWDKERWRASLQRRGRSA